MRNILRRLPFGLKYWIVLEWYNHKYSIVIDRFNPKSGHSNMNVVKTVDGPFYSRESAVEALKFWNSK